MCPGSNVMGCLTWSIFASPSGPQFSHPSPLYGHLYKLFKPTLFLFVCLFWGSYCKYSLSKNYPILWHCYSSNKSKGDSHFQQWMFRALQLLHQVLCKTDIVTSTQSLGGRDPRRQAGRSELREEGSSVTEETLGCSSQLLGKKPSLEYTNQGK